MAVGAPAWSKATRNVKNNLSTTPVSHGGTSLWPGESLGLGGTPSQHRTALRKAQEATAPPRRDKSKPIVHAFTSAFLLLCFPHPLLCAWEQYAISYAFYLALSVNTSLNSTLAAVLV